MASGGVGRVEPLAERTHAMLPGQPECGGPRSKSSVSYGSKHVEIKYHWVREHADPDGGFGRPH